MWPLNVFFRFWRKRLRTPNIKIWLSMDWHAIHLSEEKTSMSFFTLCIYLTFALRVLIGWEEIGYEWGNLFPSHHTSHSRKARVQSLLGKNSDNNDWIQAVRKNLLLGWRATAGMECMLGSAIYLKSTGMSLKYQTSRSVRCCCLEKEQAGNKKVPRGLLCKEYQGRRCKVNRATNLALEK